MAKIKVHELAKELKIEANRIIEYLNTTEYAGKGVSDGIEEQAQDMVRKKFGKKVTERKGLISKNEKETTFKGVVSVNVQQSFWGRIFNFGDVYIDLVGKNNLVLEGIAKPYELKKFLETKLVDDSQTTIIA